MALLICLDADHADVVAATLAHRPRIIANPCFIVAPHTHASSSSSSSSQSRAADAPTPAWRVAMQSKAYQLEHVAVRMKRSHFVVALKAQEVGVQSGVSPIFFLFFVS